MKQNMGFVSLCFMRQLDVPMITVILLSSTLVGCFGPEALEETVNDDLNDVDDNGTNNWADDGDDGGGHSDLVHRKLREIVPGGDQDELEAVVKGAMWACSSSTNVKRCVRQVATLLCCGGSSRSRRVA